MLCNNSGAGHEWDLRFAKKCPHTRSTCQHFCHARHLWNVVRAAVGWVRSLFSVTDHLRMAAPALFSLWQPVSCTATQSLHQQHHQQYGHMPKRQLPLGTRYVFYCFFIITVIVIVGLLEKLLPERRHQACCGRISSSFSHFICVIKSHEMLLILDLWVKNGSAISVVTQLLYNFTRNLVFCYLYATNIHPST